MNPSDVLALAREKNVKMVDFRFLDLFGTWQHFSVPVDSVDEETFSEGLGFDGSSVRGWKTIDQSDMLVVPDPITAWIDPFLAEPTLILNCNVQDCITREDYNRDPRNIARRAEAYINSTGIADLAYFGPEAEFFLFDDVSYECGTNSAHYMVDSREGHWNSGRDEGGNLGYKLRPKGGYFPVPPSDQLQDVRTEMTLRMMEAGIHVITANKLAGAAPLPAFRDMHARRRRGGSRFLQEPTVGAGLPILTTLRDLRTTGDRVAFDRRDDGLRQPHAGRAHRAVAGLGHGVAAAGGHRLEVGAGREAASGSGQDRDRRLLVGVEGPERQRQSGRGRPVDAISNRRTVDRHDRRPAALLDRYGAHFQPLPKFGARFSTNAVIASMFSAEPAWRRIASASASSAARMPAWCASLRVRLVSRSAPTGQRAISSAFARA